MNMRKVLSINTTVGKRFTVGVFSGKEMLAGAHHPYFKTRSGAQRYLKKITR